MKTKKDKVIASIITFQMEHGKWVIAIDYLSNHPMVVITAQEAIMAGNLLANKRYPTPIFGHDEAVELANLLAHIGISVQNEKAGEVGRELLRLGEFARTSNKAMAEAYLTENNTKTLLQ